jgi:hypothetical protein
MERGSIMSEVSVSGNSFIGYEYKEVLVRRDLEALYMDNYPAFGWKLEGTAPSLHSIGSVILKFKRDRRIKHKNELNKLQRQFDGCMAEVGRLEASKTIMPSVCAYTIGLAGTAFMAGSVFAVTSGNIPLCVALGIPGFLGWGLAYLMYRRLSDLREQQATPLIDHQYNLLYDVCEQAGALLAR